MLLLSSLLLGKYTEIGLSAATLYILITPIIFCISFMRHSSAEDAPKWGKTWKIIYKTIMTLSFISYLSIAVLPLSYHGLEAALIYIIISFIALIMTICRTSNIKKIYIDGHERLYYAYITLTIISFICILLFCLFCVFA